MAISPERLEALLRRIGCTFHFDAERKWFCGSMPTKVFRNRQGDRRVTVVAKAEQNGEFVRFLAPEVYDLGGREFRPQACEAAMQVAYRSNALAFELDGDTSRMWAVIEFPIADCEMTARQLEACLLLMVDLLDDYHPVLQHAIETGKVDLSRAGKTLDESGEASEVERLIRELGGIDKVKAIASSLPGA